MRPISLPLLPVALKDGDLEIGGTSVPLGLDGAVVVGDQLVGGDLVAVVLVGARVDGLRGGQVEASVLGLDVKLEGAVLARGLGDGRELVGPVEGDLAVRALGEHGRVRGDVERVGAAHAVRDAGGLEGLDEEGLLAGHQGGGRGGGGQGEEGRDELHFGWVGFVW